MELPGEAEWVEARRRKLPESNQGLVQVSSCWEDEGPGSLKLSVMHCLSVHMCQAPLDAVDAADTRAGKTLIPQAFHSSEGNTQGASR